MFEHEPDLLTRRQAQELLQVSKNTILKLIQNNELPCFIIAKSYRIPKNGLIEFIRDSRKSLPNP